MAKISKIARTRMIAAKIMEVMDAIGQRSMDAYRECERVENLSVPLADMISKGLVTAVSDEMLGMMEDTLASLIIVVEHGIGLWESAEAGMSLRVERNGEAVTMKIWGVSVDSFSASVLAPGTRRIEEYVSLLWAPRSTVIVS